jgi:hypothetical protein
LFYDADAYAYARRSEGETVIIIINRALKPKALSINADWLDAGTGARLLPLMVASDSPVATGGKFALNIPAASAVAYKLVVDEKVKEK